MNFNFLLSKSLILRAGRRTEDGFLPRLPARSEAYSPEGKSDVGKNRQKEMSKSNPRIDAKL
jgi:hypothetical protein